MDIDEEAAEATRLLAGKIVRAVRRHRRTELVIEFTDGTRFFADAHVPVEFSITGGADSD